jgi:hypothetical protein
MDPSGSGQRSMAGSCENGNEPSGLTKGGDTYWIAERLLASQEQVLTSTRNRGETLSAIQQTHTEQRAPVYTAQN